jgi:hypothetical protein
LLEKLAAFLPKNTKHKMGLHCLKNGYKLSAAYKVFQVVLALFANFEARSRAQNGSEI